MTCWLFYFHICFTELKIYHLSFFHRTVRSRHCWFQLYAGRVSNMNLLYIYSLALHPWVRILRSSSGLRAPAKWLGGHRFVSCRELRFFSLVCPTFVTCSLFHFHICFTEWKFTIIHSFVTYIILTPFLHTVRFISCSDMHYTFP